MRKPPKVTDAQMREARDAIRGRHAGDDNTSTHLLSDDPREVLDYLRRRGTAGLLNDDIVDALTIRIWLWWEGERTEVWLLEQADRRHLRAEAGVPLGIHGSQSFAQRLKYKRGLVAADTAEVVDRAPTRQRWLAEHRAQIAATAAALVDCWDLVDETTAAEVLVDVRHDLRAGVCTHASFTAVGWAVDEVAVAPAVAALPAADPRRRALASWSALAAGYPAAD